LSSGNDVVDVTKKHTYGTWRAQKGWAPLDIVDAEGCFFQDSTGRKYLDFSSQLMCSNLGHKNKAVAEAIARQASMLAYIAPSFTCQVRSDATNALRGVFPEGLDKFFFSTSGTEANEAAIKIARTFTGRYKLISRYASYHGSTAGAIAATGDFRRWYVEPEGKVEGVIFAPDAYCYRCPLGLKYPDCGIACAEYVDYMTKKEHNVAAMIVEPVVGTNGVIVPPDEYLPRIKEITKDNGVVLIADEVMSGWGRCGEWFAVNHWGVTPDIITTAKGVTGAFMPLGVTATNREISAFFEENYLPHGHTYEAHPMSLAPVAAAINEYKRLNLLEESRTKGTYLKSRLEELKARHPSIGDVRGMGLFCALELVKNRETRKPFNTMLEKFERKPLAVDLVTKDLMRQGVYVVSWVSHLVIAPPLIVTKEELDRGVSALDVSLKITDDLVEKP
jgi:taurine--2-oxoglutarate transaminase